MEIVSERVRDLLGNPDAELQIRFPAPGKAFVDGLTKCVPSVPPCLLEIGGVGTGFLPPGQPIARVCVCVWV